MNAPAQPQPASTGKRVLGGCCLGMLGLCVVLTAAGMIHEAMKSPEQKAKEAAERKAAASARSEKGKEIARTLARQFAEVYRHLPAPAELKQEVFAPAEVRATPAFTPADAAFFAAFDDVGYVSTRDAPGAAWWRARPLEDAKTVLARIAKGEDFYFYEIENAFAELAKKKYVGVLIPVLEKAPKLSDDGKTFSAGVFMGWVVLVELETGKPVCQVRFTGQSSESVHKTRLKVAGVKIGSLQSALDDDYHEQVFAAALNAIASKGK